jgi:acyl carrier protein
MPVEHCFLENLVAEVLEVPPAEVTGQTGPRTQGAWTSLRHLMIVDAAQRAYAVTVRPRDIRSIRTVDDLREVLLASGAQL